MGKLSTAFLISKGVLSSGESHIAYEIEKWLDEFAGQVAFQAYHEGYFNSLEKKDISFDKWWEEINKEQ